MTTPRLARRTAPRDRGPSRPSEGPRPRAGAPSPGWALALPSALAAVVGAFALFTTDPVLDRIFLGAAGALLVWCAVLYRSARRANRVLAIEITPRKQHWLQAAAQSTLILYWAWHTPLVRAFLPFILVQLVFAYAVDSLVAWSRRDTYALGFGPFPVIFSINLFLLFRPGWFYWQFVMIALGFAAKEFIRWTRDGRSVHVFNPSSFPLAVFSLGLLLTGTTDITFGNAIANTLFDTPHIYLVIFLVAVPAQLIFGVSRVTLSAVVTLFAISRLYLAATGTYLFYDADIPAAVFLGMHLLVTDPSTSPKTDLGRIVFGALYAIGTAVLFVLLESHGAPTFYDKLLPIPILNLMVRGIDRIARSRPLSGLDPARLFRSLTPVRTNAVYTSLWAAVFVALSAVQGVGDKHPGQYLPFWLDACRDGSARACTYVVRLTVVYCKRGSGWACNEVGVLDRRLGRPADADFRRACELGFAAGCENLTRSAGNAGTLARGRPLLRDLPVVLSGTKPTLRERDPAKLHALACEQGWPGACAGDAAGQQP